MLAGKGFDNIINVAGGIKAWDGQVAVGAEDLGLQLFTGKESIDETLVVAYSLEAGLRDFYLSMIQKGPAEDIRRLFEKLSEIERKHQDQIFHTYLDVTGKKISRDAFDQELVVQAVEGGLTTDEYVQMYQPDWNSAIDIISLAMSIEAQALDLYTRAADRSTEPRSRDALNQIAAEERVHLEQLGKLMDTQSH
jgi:rubrerythrin